MGRKAIRSFPSISIRNWWTLRKHLQDDGLPRQLTAKYIANLFEREPRSAQNMIRPLRSIGLIDAEFKPTQRARRWCDDDEYSNVCAEILERIFPSELSDAFPDSETSYEHVLTSFMRLTGLKKESVRNVAGFYLLLCRADPSEQHRDSLNELPLQVTDKKFQSKPKADIPKTKPIEKGEVNGTISEQSIKSDLNLRTSKEELLSFEPSLHINIQIHIPSDATAEQIDNIFKSMANHLSSPGAKS